MKENKLFYYDLETGESKSYFNLFEDILLESDYYPYCSTNSFYEVFKRIIFSLVLGEEIVLLDSDFTEDEIAKLIGDSHLLEYKKEVFSPIMKLDFESTNELISRNKDRWKITLFTSGTTGVPKRISHSFDSIARNTKVGIRYEDNIWGFAYNPTHMAGIQVFFQAFLNNNTIVRLFGLSKETIFEQIKCHGITNLSATPTFYRLLLPCDGVYPNIRRITTGGERFDSGTIQHMMNVFPNSKITNVYASTEAGSLFAAKGDIFTVKNDISAKVKVVDNELMIHHSLLGESFETILNTDWYSTGDLVSVISSDPLTFTFTSRKNEMINVGGYKVNPLEVEDCIREIYGVLDVCVFGKKNSLLGNVVCCHVVRSNDKLTEVSIREYLQERLQEFKIPRMVKFVTKIELTRTGKVSRK